MMSDIIKRIEVELNELTDRLDKLEAHMYTEAFYKNHDPYLHEQRKVMREYKDLLLWRINNIKNP
ncbi:coil containing protein [Vibrio phage 1.262.O._10N.286.51.A9]|nr:coil containing protein [Vibrio phage 1.262.O._10N.286.51.A9]